VIPLVPEYSSFDVETAIKSWKHINC